MAGLLGQHHSAGSAATNWYFGAHSDKFEAILWRGDCSQLRELHAVRQLQLAWCCPVGSNPIKSRPVGATGRGGRSWPFQVGARIELRKEQQIEHVAATYRFPIFVHEEFGEAFHACTVFGAKWLWTAVLSGWGKVTARERLAVAEGTRPKEKLCAILVTWTGGLSARLSCW